MSRRTRELLSWVGLGALVALTPACAAAGPMSNESDANGEDSLTSSKSVSFQNGVSPAPSYAGASGTNISESTPTATAGTSPTLHADADYPDGSGKSIEALLRFDLSSIPAGSNITSVSLTVNVTNRTSGAGFSLYPVERAWSESRATWDVAATGEPWGSAGARASSDHGDKAAGVLAPEEFGTSTIELTAAGVAAVSSWVNTPAENFGLILDDEGDEDGLEFDSSNATTAANRPRLTVTYEPPQASPPFVFGTTQPDGDNSGVGVIAAAPTTVHEGDYTISTAGETVKDLIVTGRILVDADDVTVENCEVRLEGVTSADRKDNWGIYVKKGHHGVLVHYNTVHATSPNQNTNAFGIGGATWEHNEAYDVVDGFDPQESGFVFRGNYIHDLFVGPVDSSIHSDKRTHSDGIEFEGGGGTVLGNTIVATASSKSTYTADGPTSALMFPGDATISDVSATKNWLSHGDITINMGSSGNSTTTGTVSSNVITSPAASNTAFVKNNHATGVTATGNVDGSGHAVVINYVSN